jgi:hypothetical protein
MLKGVGFLILSIFMFWITYKYPRKNRTFIDTDFHGIVAGIIFLSLAIVCFLGKWK